MSKEQNIIFCDYPGCMKPVVQEEHPKYKGHFCGEHWNLANFIYILMHNTKEGDL